MSKHARIGKFGSLFEIIIMVISIISFAYIISPDKETLVSGQRDVVCCEKTKSGGWCQNLPSSQCNPSFQSAPTSCEATSFCRLGCCYDSSEGICMENTPQKVCEDSQGIWRDSASCDIPQCELGCCILGVQAAFTTSQRCRTLSKFYNLDVDFKKNVGNEIECINLASLSDEGACVYEIDFARTCKFATRQECKKIAEGMSLEDRTVTSNATFYKDYLCSSSELNTNCAPTTQTTCVDGKDGVYFVDSCGNPANIYDSEKANEQAYWNKIVKKENSCGYGNTNGNANSKTCGNCDYFYSSICKKVGRGETQPVYGSYICKNLDCKLEDGTIKKNGESWCYHDKPAGKSDSVGSRYFRYACINGNVILEPCDDFRQEVCLESSIEGFSQAGCIVNRWQDCVLQTDKIDCENTDKRDCKWTIAENKVAENGTIACIPKNAPGLEFWNEESTKQVCNAGSVTCTIKEKKSLLTGWDWECKENCECLTESWRKEMEAKCSSLGDCGVKVNWVGTSSVKRNLWNIESLLPIIKVARALSILALKNFEKGVVSGENGGAKQPEAATKTEQKTTETELQKQPSQPQIISNPTGETAAKKLIPHISTGWVTNKYTVGENTIAYNHGTNNFDVFDKDGKNLGTYRIQDNQVQKLTGAVGNRKWEKGELPEGITNDDINQIASQTPVVGWGATIGKSLGAAIAAYGAVQMIMAMVAPEEDALVDPISYAAAIGVGVGRAIALGGKSTAAQWGWGLLAAAITFWLAYKDEREKEVAFECLPYEPPVGGKDCEKCNSDEMPCTEYRCKALGQACQIINKGTTEEKCVWVNPRDVTSPVISPNENVLTLGYKYILGSAGGIRPPAIGFRIAREDGSCLKAFTPVTFGINTDEPTSCKADYNHTLSFGNMTYYFGGSNTLKYNHTQVLSVPGTANINSQNPTIKSDGEYNLFIRCQDANGNSNAEEYVVKFCVEKGPDVTPPRIEATSIMNGMPVRYNANEMPLEIYLNEPAECRWSRIDKNYESMEGNFSCPQRVEQMNARMLYTCKTTLTGIKNQEDNKYYIRCKDQPVGVAEKDRNTNQESYEFVLKGTKPLDIVKIGPNETVRGATTLVPVYLSVETDNGYNFGDSICFYGTSKEQENVKFFETGTNKHSQRLDLPAGIHTYYIKCVDLGGNTDYESVRFRVEVDQKPPVVARVYQYEGNLMVKTDEISECAYNSNSETKCNFKISEGINMPYSNSTEHATPWEVGKTYYIKCADSSGNEPLPTECSIIVKTTQ